MVADCRIFRVHAHAKVRSSHDPLRAGSKRDFFVIQTADFVTVVALTPNMDVVAIEQYRHGVDRFSIEMPSGLVDPGEDALTAAKRELLEETGYEAPRWVLLAELDANSAIMDNNHYSFLALDARPVQEQELDVGESIRNWEMPLSDSVQMLHSGKIRHVYSALALTLAERWIHTRSTV